MFTVNIEATIEEFFTTMELPKAGKTRFWLLEYKCSNENDKIINKEINTINMQRHRVEANLIQ